MSDIINSLYAGHIANNLQMYEAARSAFFTFQFDSSANEVRWGDDRSFKQKLFDKLVAQYKPADGHLDSETFLDNVTLNVTSSSVPQFSLGTLEYKRGNDTIKMAGMPTFDAGSIRVDDVVGLDTKSILMAWKELAYDPITRRGGRMKDYKVDCVLCEYTQDFQLVRTWRLYGCWISKLDDAEFNRETDDKRSITCSIEYDRAIMELPS